MPTIEFIMGKPLESLTQEEIHIYLNYLSANKHVYIPELVEVLENTLKNKFGETNG